MNESYQIKYLKYKNKYLELKKNVKLELYNNSNKLVGGKSSNLFDTLICSKWNNKHNKKWGYD